VQEKGGGVGKGVEMTQTLYAHMNKIKIKEKEIQLYVAGQIHSMKA
jgi:hypothetical protein